MQELLAHHQRLSYAIIDDVHYHYSQLSMPPPTDDQLSEILTILRAMNKRDRIRTWGGFVRGCIAIIPVLLVLWSAWYVVENGQSLLQMIAKTAASAAAAVTESQSKSMVDGLMKTMTIPSRK